MQFIKRMFFFILTNIAVLAFLSVVMFVVNMFFPGILDAGGGMGGIMIYAVVFGFAGSFISLWISRWMAKRAYNIVLLERQSASSDAKLQVVWDTVDRIATKNKSLVAVSTGLLNRMEKGEIEGVVGHEMAHILN